jgi:uncharacterized membrane protein
MNKKMRVFISISVLLNVLLIGVVMGKTMGGMSKHHDDRNHSYAHIDKRLVNILEVLPAEKREAFKQRFLEWKELKRTEKNKMKTARKHLIAVFEQEPFDKDTYQKAVISLNNLHQNQVGKHMNLMADMAEYLSPKERKQLARIIMKRGRRK